MEKIQRVIVVLLIIAIVFSVVSTLLNFSIIDFEFKPVEIRIPSNVDGNPSGNVKLVIEGNGGTG